MERMASSLPGAAVAVPAALALLLSALPAQAEMTSFTCSGERLERRVVTSPVTFQKASTTPISTTFVSHLQAVKLGKPTPVQMTANCEVKLDVRYIDQGYDRSSGRIKPVDGAYRMAVDCTARGDNGAGYRAMEVRVALPAPAQGGPYDTAEGRSRFDEAACRAATSAILGAIRR